MKLFFFIIIEILYVIGFFCLNYYFTAFSTPVFSEFLQTR